MISEIPLLIIYSVLRNTYGECFDILIKYLFKLLSVGLTFTIITETM